MTDSHIPIFQMDTELSLHDGRLPGGVEVFEQWLERNYADLGRVTTIRRVPKNVIGNIEILARCTHIRNLDLNGCRGIEGDIKVLRSCKQLMSVNFSGCDGMDRSNADPPIKCGRGIHGDIAILASCPLLQDVNFEYCCKVTGDIAVLGKLKKLIRVVMSGDNDFPMKVIGDISVLGMLEDLQCVEMGHCYFVAGDIASLGYCKDLKSVKMRACDEVFGDIVALGNCKKLTSVDLAGEYGSPMKLTGDIKILGTNCRQITDVSFNFCIKIKGNIGALGNCKELTRLDVGYCRQVYGSFEVFDGLDALSNLDVGGTEIDCSRAFELLPTMPWAAQIQKLSFRGTNVQGDIEVFGCCKVLASVNLAGCDGYDSNLRKVSKGVRGDIAVFANSERLVSVDLRFCKRVTGNLNVLASCSLLTDVEMTSTGVEGEIADLKEFKQLAKVSLKYCDISGKMDQAAFDTLCSVDSLELDDVLFEFASWAIARYKESGRYLEEIKGVPDAIKGSIDVLEFVGSDLKRLDLSGCSRIRGDIAVLKHCKNLQAVDMRDCRSVSGHFFPALASLSNLETHHFDGCFQLFGAAYKEQLHSLVRHKTYARSPPRRPNDELEWPNGPRQRSEAYAMQRASTFFSDYAQWRSSEEATAKCYGAVSPLDATDEERSWFHGLFENLVNGPSPTPLNKEWLLLLSVDYSILAAAQVLASDKFFAQGTLPVEADAKKRIATQQPSSNAALQALLNSMVSAHVVTTYINTVAGYEDSIDPSVLLMFATKLACAVINGAVVLKSSNYAAPVRFCLHPTPE